MDIQWLRVLITGILLVTLSACGGGSGTGSDNQLGGSGTGLTGITSISVGPAFGLVKVGGTLQMRATGTFSDGSSRDVSSEVNWMSIGDATINNAGLVTGTGIGSASISANDFATPSIAAGTVISVAAYGVEGTQSLPVSVTANTPHAGEVNSGGSYTDGLSHYHATVTAGATYYVRLSGMSANADLEVFDDAAFSQNLCSSSNYGTSDEQCVVVGPASGDLFIRVNGNETRTSSDGGTAYQLDVIRGYSNQGVDAPIDIPLNTPISSEVGLGSSRFAVPVVYSAKYTVTVTGLLEDAELMLLKNGNIVVCQSYNSGLADESCSFQADITDQITISVSSDYYSQDIGTPFILTVTEDHGPYSSEGTTTTPVTVIADTSYSGQVASDSSYYSIAVTAGQSYQIRLSSLDASAALYVYDGDGGYSSVSCSTYYGSTERICMIEPALTDTLYIKVSGNTFGADYTLDASTVTYNAEGTLAAPKALGVAPTIYDPTPYAGQVDNSASYYRVTVESAAIYHVALANVSGDIALAVYDDAGFTTELCNSNNPALADEGCTTAGPNSTTELYIKVSGSTYGSRFDLTVDRVYGPQGSTTTPIDITGQLPYTGETGPSTNMAQQSFYQLSLTVGKTYRFILSNRSHEDIELMVHDENPTAYPYPASCTAGRNWGNQDYTCIIEPVTSGVVNLRVRATSTLYGAGFSINVEEIAYQAEGSIAAPVALGSFPVPDDLYGEITDNDPLTYYGQSGANSSYYSADISGGYDYVGYTVSLTGQGADADLYVYSDAAYSLEVCSSNNDSNVDESCSFTTASNMIYIRVDGSPSGFGSVFNIDIDHDYNAEGSPITGNGGNQTGGALPLTLGVSHQGEAANGASSYYQVPVTSGLNYSVDITNLFNAACIYVYPNDDGTFTAGYGNYYTSDKWLRDKSIAVPAASDLLHIMVVSCDYPVRDGTAYTITVNPN